MTKRIGSKQLWLYLSEKGLLNASEDAIARAKAEYKRKYKREWKMRHKRPEKELRVVLSIKQYLDLKIKASGVGLRPTPYLKELALATIVAKQIVPENESLKKILQLITMTAISTNSNMLLEAEKRLLEYVQKYGSD